MIEAVITQLDDLDLGHESDDALHLRPGREGLVELEDGELEKGRRQAGDILNRLEAIRTSSE